MTDADRATDPGPTAAGAAGPPPRVAVMHQRRAAARVTAPATHVGELAEETRVGEVLLDTLMRRQLRLGLRLLAVTALPLALLPALFDLAPGLARAQVAGVPVAWAALGVGVYPLLFLAARSHLRRCRRNEAEFVELVNRR